MKTVLWDSIITYGVFSRASGRKAERRQTRFCKPSAFSVHILDIFYLPIMHCLWLDVKCFFPILQVYRISYRFPGISSFFLCRKTTVSFALKVPFFFPAYSPEKAVSRRRRRTGTGRFFAPDSLLIHNEGIPGPAFPLRHRRGL